MRYPIPFLVLLIPLLLAGVAQALADNLYTTMPPDSSACITTRLPIDLNTLSKGYYTLETSSGLPVNLAYISAFAEVVNIVRVPICFYSQGTRDGDYSYYTIRASTLGVYREFEGGICITETLDIESRAPEEGQNPCELINGYEDLFYMSFLESIQWAQPGSRTNYTLLVQSMNPLDLDITLSSSLQLTPERAWVSIPETGRAESIPIEVTAPSSGTHQITASARVKIGDSYCDIPFCFRQANTTLSVGSSASSGFSLFAFPQFLSVDFAGPIPYTLFIENLDDEALFDLEISLPEGLESDWTRKSLSIKRNERREVKLNITPLSQDPGYYLIGFRASSAGLERTQEAHLSVREIESDILRRWDSLDDNLSVQDREDISLEIDKFLAGYRADGFDPDEYKEIDSLLDEVEGSAPAPDGQPEPGPLNPLLIAIPAIAVILALIYMFYKKSRPFEMNEEEF